MRSLSCGFFFRPLSLESRFFVSFIKMVRLFKQMKWRSREKRGFTISLEKKMSEKMVLILMKKQQKQQPMLGQECRQFIDAG